MLMDIANRIKEAEQKFNTKQAERDDHLRQAEECLEEMHRLQGEYRALLSMQEEKSAAKVIEVKSEEEQE